MRIANKFRRGSLLQSAGGRPELLMGLMTFLSDDLYGSAFPIRPMSKWGGGVFLYPLHSLVSVSPVSELI